MPRQSNDPSLQPPLTRYAANSGALIGILQPNSNADNTLQAKHIEVLTDLQVIVFTRVCIATLGRWQ